MLDIITSLHGLISVFSLPIGQNCGIPGRDGHDREKRSIIGVDASRRGHNATNARGPEAKGQSEG